MKNLIRLTFVALVLFLSNAYALSSERCQSSTPIATAECLLDKYADDLMKYNIGQRPSLPGHCQFITGVAASVCVQDQHGNWRNATALEEKKGTACLLNQLRNPESVAAANHPETGIHSVEGYPVVNELGIVNCPHSFQRAISLY